MEPEKFYLGEWKSELLKYTSQNYEDDKEKMIKELKDKIS